MALAAAIHDPRSQAAGVVISGLIVAQGICVVQFLREAVAPGGDRPRCSTPASQPEWLSHVNATVLKVKLTMAIIGISSIHLLATFTKTRSMDGKTIVWQTLLRLTFVVSAVALAYIDKLTLPGGGRHAGAH